MIASINRAAAVEEIIEYRDSGNHKEIRVVDKYSGKIIGVIKKKEKMNFEMFLETMSIQYKIEILSTGGIPIEITSITKISTDLFIISN